MIQLPRPGSNLPNEKGNVEIAREERAAVDISTILCRVLESNWARLPNFHAFGSVERIWARGTAGRRLQTPLALLARRRCPRWGCRHLVALLPSSRCRQPPRRAAGLPPPQCAAATSSCCHLLIALPLPQRSAASLRLVAPPQSAAASSSCCRLLKTLSSHCRLLLCLAPDASTVRRVIVYSSVILDLLSYPRTAASSPPPRAAAAASRV